MHDIQSDEEKRSAFTDRQQYPPLKQDVRCKLSTKASENWKTAALNMSKQWLKMVYEAAVLL